jgi:hypothetical protein
MDSMGDGAQLVNRLIEALSDLAQQRAKTSIAGGQLPATSSRMRTATNRC